MHLRHDLKALFSYTLFLLKKLNFLKVQEKRKRLVQPRQAVCGPEGEVAL